MSRWWITSGAGVDLGTYEGATADDARDAMARDAGYRDDADACRQSGDDGSHLRVVEVPPCPDCGRPLAVGDMSEDSTNSLTHCFRLQTDDRECHVIERDTDKETTDGST